MNKHQAKTTAKYVIYSDPKDAQLGASLFRVLIGTDRNVRFEKSETMDKAIESDANVIIVVATGRIRREGSFNWNLDKESLDSLKNRKVIGIGYGRLQGVGGPAKTVMGRIFLSSK